jgi:excisionase family DNA binding protein
MKPNTSPLEKRCFTATEICAVLGISRKTLQRIERRGLIKSLKVIRTKLFPLEELNRFLKEAR